MLLSCSFGKTQAETHRERGVKDLRERAKGKEEGVLASELPKAPRSCFQP